MWKKKSLIWNFMVLFVVMTLVILSAFVFLVAYVQNTALREAEKNLEKKYEQVDTDTGAYLDNLENVAFSVCYSTSTQRYFQETEALNRILMGNDMKTLYMNTRTMMEDISGMCLYDRNGKVILSYGEHAYKLPSELEGSIQYSGKFRASSGDEKFGLIYPVYEIKQTKLLGDIIGYVGLSVSTNQLKQFVLKSNVLSESEILLLDENGTVLASNMEKPQEIITDNEKYMDTGRYISFITEIDRAGWKLICAMPKGVIAEEFFPIVVFMIAAGCLVLILILLMTSLISKRILRPIGKLGKFMEYFPQSTGKERFEVTLKNEIGFLGETMNHMLDALDERDEQLKISENDRLKAEVARQQMEILAYRNQINPHFLYNTLECIRGIAFYREAPEIVEISQALSNMLRYAVKGGNVVRICEEVKYIEEYARIIFYRFNNRITINCHIPEEMEGYSISKLCLQPIVENAVLHGLETKRGKGTIEITGRIEGKMLVIMVEDDGVGMDENTQEELQEIIHSAYRKESELPTIQQHVGISNIARRLFLNYGDRSSIRIESHPGEGTRVTLQIPEKAGEETDV